MGMSFQHKRSAHFLRSIMIAYYNSSFLPPVAGINNTFPLYV